MRCLGDSDLSVVSFDAFDMCHVSFEDSDTWPLTLKLRLHKSPLTAALWKVREDANALKVSLSSATKHKAKCLRKTDLLTGGFWLCDVTLPDDTFREWLKKGTLVRDQEESFTCYMDFFKMMKEPFCQMTPAMWELEERPWIHACGTSPPAPQWTFYVPLDKKTCDMMLPECWAWMEAANHRDMWALLKRNLDFCFNSDFCVCHCCFNCSWRVLMID